MSNSTDQISGDSAVARQARREPVCLKQSHQSTFDDDPSPFIDRLLGILADNEAKVTFFLIGNKVARPRCTVPPADCPVTR